MVGLASLYKICLQENIFEAFVIWFLSISGWDIE